MKCHDVHLSSDTVCLLLPSHKADRFFEGSTLQSASPSAHSSFLLFWQYLALCDACFRWLPELWILANGKSPTRAWLNRLRCFFPSTISGHSMRAGGVTALVLAGVPDDLIHFHGWWSSDAYQFYLHHNPGVFVCTVYSVLL